MRAIASICWFVLLCQLVLRIDAQDVVSVPDSLDFGTATSSYQVEGAWNEDGKTESIWDHFTHYSPGSISDRSTGDVACDSYHKLDEDVSLLKELGVKYYRFSLSWPRILPNGFANKINTLGIAYYNRLVDALISNKITPVVTLYHWEMPQTLQNLGGFANPASVEWFEDFARVAFKNFGDRVKIWTTINEPKQICHLGYGVAYFAPGLNSSGLGDYLCAHNVLKAHARAYHLYDREYRNEQQGKIGIVIECSWSESATNETLDLEAAQRRRDFDFGIYANPIFGENGDFPETVKSSIWKRSKMEGFIKSRLPEFTAQEIKYIKGTSDYFGLNHYTTILVKNALADPLGDPSFEKDMQVNAYQCDNWLTGSIDYFRLVPWGLRKMLTYIRKNYGNPEIIITETGFPDLGEIDDKGRQKYLKGGLETVTRSITEDQVNVKIYMVWSLMDNFEWALGYSSKFGLYHVDFNDPNRKRTAKGSLQVFRDIIRTRQFERVADINDKYC